MRIMLWKENKTDQGWQISVSDLVARFMKSERYTDKDALYYHGVDMSLAAFISDKDGLNSVIEKPDFERACKCLWDIINKKWGE